MKIAAPTVVAAQVILAPVPIAAGQDTMKRIIDIVASVRALAGDAEKIAKNIEDAALDIEARMERNHAETGKLRQLQELLKSIGN